jgi:hypothetical protein
MPAFLEKKLDKEYPNEPDAKYKIMNSLGVMRGNKETAKGRREEKMHEAKTRALHKHK